MDLLPRKLTWQWKIHHEWRCISYWRWGFFQCHGSTFFTKFYHHFSRDVTGLTPMLWGSLVKITLHELGVAATQILMVKKLYFVSKLGDRHKFVRCLILAENHDLKAHHLDLGGVYDLFLKAALGKLISNIYMFFYIFGSRINVQCGICNESSAQIECAWWEWWIHGQCSFLCHVARCHVCLWNHTSTSSSSHESRHNWIERGKQSRLFRGFVGDEILPSYSGGFNTPL